MACSPVEESKRYIARTQKTNQLKTFLALAIWLCVIHLVIFLLILMVFVLPFRWSLTLGAVLVTLMVIPLFEKSALAEFVSRFVCKHGPGHFPVTVVIDDKDALDPNQAYVFAVEPHAVIPLGVVGLCENTGLLPLKKLKGFASSAVFYTPILRHVWTWLGLAPAKRKLVVDSLKQGYSCVLIPGGVSEMLYMEPDREVVYLKKRFGFIRIAIEMGAPLVPTFIFGHTHIYKWWKPKGMLYNEMSRVLKFAPLLFWGMYGTPIPFPRPLYVAIGKPIELKKNPQPTQEEILEVQALFLSALQDLYDRHKADAGYKDTPLYVY
ncbi:hypothetical protein GOP47_0023457 [Adiantum capillus-veneris]|uniref:Acyltransferase n=2 Tax=Adiantum capillus-veneris TaxID=13818 RepID=A0A9D4Z554_ADICA|nr:hypothetical protein GOP47_0023457 [Adiantum capillus-veneris]